MKRTAAILGLFFLATIWLGAATIKVTQPYEIQGEPKFTGTTQTIAWTNIGTLPDKVKITLRNETSTTELKVIADPAPNNGTYSWTIPAGLADAKYIVRVKGKGVDVYGDSTAFAIVTEPKITITSPQEGETWQETTQHTITWTTKGKLANTVKVWLLNSDWKPAWPPDGIIDAQAANSGSLTWTVPGTLNVNYVYKLCIASNWNTVINGVASDRKTLKLALKIQIKNPPVVKK